MQKAYNTLDYNKCIFILIVIVTHIVSFGRLYLDIQNAMVIVVNPAFLMVTGYLVNIQKDWKEFGRYLMRIFLPYAIMSLAYGIASVYLPVRFGLPDCKISTLIQMLLINPIGPYWFFHTLIICSLLYYIPFRYLKQNKVTAYFIFGTLLLIFSRHLELMNTRFAMGFFIGAGVRIFANDFHNFFRPSLFAIFPLALLCQPEPTSWGDITVLGMACCFICFFSKLTINRSGSIINIMGYIGRNTFPVYIFHPIFTMLCKQAEGVFSFDKTGLLITLFTVACSTAGSLLLAYILDRTNGSILLGRKRILR